MLLGGDEAFRCAPEPQVLMDRNLVIRAANPAYLRVIERSEDTLVSEQVFDAFPPNPEEPAGNGVGRLSASFEHVLRTGTEHNMVIQRYDIYDPNSARFQQRHWMPVNSPVYSEGRVVGIRHKVRDVTVLRTDVLAAMEHYRDVLNGDHNVSRETEYHRFMINTLTEGLIQSADLADEIAQLRQALTTRASIEQAKGMLMATRRCSADEAFGILRKLSQDTNVRLADVAAALIYQLQAAN